MGHSPPIATRTGWISIAILPFLMYVPSLLSVSTPNCLSRLDSVFATKVNLIGMFTGFSHYKLQVYHRWTAWVMCASCV